MAYGSKVTSDGKEIAADSSKVLPIVPPDGILEGVSVKDVFMLGEMGDKVVASITFVQPNGGEVIHREWKSDEESNQDDTNRRLKHICTKFVTEAEYTAMLDTCDDNTTFEELMEKARTLIQDKIAGTEGLFRMIFVYNKGGYVSIPRYPNFIERMDTNPTTKLQVSKYDEKFLVKPAAAKPDPEMNVETEDLPFGS